MNKAVLRSEIRIFGKIDFFDKNDVLHATLYHLFTVSNDVFPEKLFFIENFKSVNLRSNAT